MSLSMLARQFEESFINYVDTSNQEYLSQISDIGAELVRLNIYPAHIGKIFETSLKGLAQKKTDMGLSLQIAEKIAIPISELLAAYSDAFTEYSDSALMNILYRFASKLIEHTMDAIWLTDRHGNVQLINPSFSKMTGYELSEIKGQHISCLGIFCSDETISRKIWEIISKDGVWRGELRTRRKNGDIFPALLNISTIPLENDYLFVNQSSVITYVGILNDISDKHRQESIKLELDRAREIYNIMVQPQLPQLDGVEINVKCIPAEDIGGDIIEIVKVDEKKVIIFLADISGHGVSAAMTANALKVLFREVSETIGEPVKILQYINKMMYKNMLQDDLIAAFCGLVDLGQMTITYCLNGLPQPIIYRNGEVIRLVPTGFPLGIFEVFDGKSSIFQIQRGDMLILFSDGVTEIRSESGEIFGNIGLERCLNNRPFTVHTLIDHILTSAAVFQQRNSFQDDIIILAASFYDDKSVPSKTSRSNTYNFPTKSMCKGKTKFLFIDEVVAFFQNFITEKTRIPKEELGWLKIVLFELVLNAIEHGNLKLTEYKNNSEFYDSEEYWKIFNERMMSEEYGNKEVVVECDVNEDEIRITVQDEGDGFDTTSIQKPVSDETVSKPSGRGIALVRMNVDKLMYNYKGNAVTIIKKI